MSKPVSLRRSVLYVPGNKARALKKARTLPVDAIIFDLEDAVAESEKGLARKAVCRAVADEDYGDRFRVVRINDLRSKTGRDDLEAVILAQPDAVLLPKVERALDLVELAQMIEQAPPSGSPSSPEIWAMMETPLAVLQAKEIGELAKKNIPHLTTFVMGVNDLARETGIGAAHLRPWLMTCVLAAKAYGLTIIDGVYNDYCDEVGLRDACKQGREQGMDGKSLIHPGQIAICNECFSPTSDEILEAEKLVALFEQAGHENANILKFEGRMVERLHYEMAQKVLGTAAEIADGQRHV